MRSSVWEEHFGGQYPEHRSTESHAVHERKPAGKSQTRSDRATAERAKAGVLRRVERAGGPAQFCAIKANADEYPFFSGLDLVFGPYDL